MAARTTDQAPADDPVLGLLAKRKAEALARAEKEHNQLASAAKVWAQGTKLVTDAEEKLRQGREKQDSAIAAMLDAGLDGAAVAETLGITPKAVTEAVKRHRALSGDAPAAEAKPRATRTPRAKAPADEPAADGPVTADAGSADADGPAPAETDAKAADGADSPAAAADDRATAGAAS